MTNKKKESCFLIVNADDANLTEGVNRAILEAHETGIVTSATFLINLPIQSGAVRAFKKARSLGLGLHLNVSLGTPVSKLSQIGSLVQESGDFRKKDSLLKRPPSSADLFREYKNQILLFRKCFGVLPTHLDTHHQLHDHPFYFRTLLQTARAYRLPLRRSSLLKKQESLRGGVRFSNSLLGNLNSERYWRKKELLTSLKKAGEGLHEVMCHPGIVDTPLRAITSFTEGRQKELRLFSSARLKREVKKLGIQLTHYGVCYT